MLRTRWNLLLLCLGDPRPSGRDLGRALVGALPWALLALALELVGRRSPHELLDLLGAAVLGLAVLLLVTRTERRWGVLWERHGRARWRSWLAGWRLEVGLDLRGDPPYPQRLPRRVCDLLFVSWAAAAVLWLSRGSWPSGAREAVRQVSGLVWLALVLLLVVGLLVGTVVGLFAAVFALANQVKHRLPKRVRHRLTSREGLLVLGLPLAALSLALAVLVPSGYALVTCLLLGALQASLLSGRAGGIPLLWRVPPDGPLAAGRAGTWLMGTMALPTGLAAALILASRGEALFDATAGGSRVFPWLGSAFAWAATLGIGGCLLDQVCDSLRALWNAPSSRGSRRVHVTGVARTARRATRAELARAGWQACFPRREPPPRAVHLHLVAQPEPASDATGASWPPADAWPRRVAPAELGSSELAAALSRRAALQQRRALYAGFERLLRAAAREGREDPRGHRGSGLWLAPHLWFVPYASRDVGHEEGLEEPVGPPFRRLFPRAARAHLAEALRDLEVDLLFLEDGVGFQRFRRVLAQVFEFHDLFGARRLEDLRHFAGLPGVRVIVHDLTPDEPFRSTRYPEPDTEDLSRARILHVFRDRGEDGERDEAPVDREGEPRPVLLPTGW